ncbi:cell envelope integrity protein CreD [Algoriphagus aestuariicola]|uniref:Cell envelope integrity protein CreD n=1 Tax=Algoriphagus aestuariicola TaxID=1852016 RepID=A0ABS3BKK2_9BACT|nr:cell envelope integrity protein CreD [Algoriphagus aestuariicola]MBN7799824.1 cell envelope integrity protein CreD [Algoriphagus aestuariicola]
MEIQSNSSIIDRTQHLVSKSISIKLLVIGFIVAILLIPQSMTLNLIQERQSRMEEAEEDVSSKWSRSQTLAGPFLGVPFYQIKQTETAGQTKTTKELRTAYFFPEDLAILGKLEAQSLHRGIFDVVVYSGDLELNAKFQPLPLGKLSLQPDQMLWDQAALYLGLSDLRGIGENPQIKIDGTTFAAEPFSDEKTLLKGLQIPLQLDSANLGFDFSGKLKVKGSREFQVAPVGKTTQMQLSGNWPSPSFQGEFLPEFRELTEESFSSHWKVLHFNRPFGQEFIGKIPVVENSAFGLSLKLPADQYQQSVRTSKYAVLIIILSFLSLFLMEVFTKKRIHPLQYTLVGFSLVLYYTLLIALSEQLGFQLAYFLASTATVGLLAGYAKSLFGNLKTTALFAGILIVFYSFIFVIVKQQEYALLIGSIGLFVALATTMFISRKIDWYKD